MDKKIGLKEVEVLRAAKVIEEYCDNFREDCCKCILFDCCAEMVQDWKDFLPTLKERNKNG